MAPISEHKFACRLNLQNLTLNHKIVFVEAALDLESGNNIIYSNQINYGHTTFDKNLIPEGRAISRNISTISIRDFENKFLVPTEK